MLGEGIGIADLFALLNAVKNKELILEVKTLDRPWEPVNLTSLKVMTDAIKEGKVQGGQDIRLRLHAKESGLKP